MSTNVLQNSTVSTTVTKAGVEDVSVLVLLARGAIRAVTTLISAFEPRAETAEESAARLNKVADEYESTQPSFAADLRAAIGRPNNT